MNSRTFILPLACLTLGAAGVITWAVLDKKDTRERGAAVSSAKPSRAASHSTKDKNRYANLTENSTRWQVRVDQLRRMDATTLNPTEIDDLYSKLHHQPSSQKEAWWVVMNEIMEQIVKQEIASERIIPEFSALISDITLDPVVRDYAVQHLSYYLGNKGPNALDSSAQSEKGTQTPEHVLNTLAQIIKSPENQHNSIPGTTFMGLIEISQNPHHAEQVAEVFEQLESYLMPLIAGESSASLANRTSAINAVGITQSAIYLPTLKKLATSGDAVNDSVKLSSIAALGDFYARSGKPSPANLSHSRDSVEASLESIVASDTKFKHAATAALKKLRDGS